MQQKEESFNNIEISGEEKVDKNLESFTQTLA
jgi:hypothetical protein